MDSRAQPAGGSSHGARHRLLAVFAHPDDESFLAGGTLALHATRGWDVRLVCATRGEAGRRGPYGSLSVGEFAAVRSAELEEACEALGIGPPRFLDAADGVVARYAEDFRARTVDALRVFQPDIVITFGPDGISGHPDHVAVHAFVTSAFDEWCRMLERSVRHDGHGEVPRLYYVLRSAAVPACCRPDGSAPPPLTTVVDVARVGDRKLAGMRCYRSQSHLHPAADTDIRSLVESPEHFHRASPPWTHAAVAMETVLWVEEPSALSTSAARLALRRQRSVAGPRRT